jgi:Copper type II ascorbate-dependent monooxygenase, C-terminal domain
MNHHAKCLALVAVSLACGCSNSTDAFSDGPTFYQDVAPLMAEHCWSCHSEGNIAYLPLTSYARASAAAELIVDVTESGRMPPYHVDASGDCQSFRDARTLSDRQLELLADWADAGAPAGDETPLPHAAPPTELSEVSVTLDPGESYVPDPALDDDYRCFLVDPAITSDRFLTAYRVRPGELAEVHHVLLYSTDNAAEAARAAQLDAAEPGPGYTCFGGSGTGAGRTLAGWAPGTGATRYPEGTGLRVIGGQPLIMQIHYNQNAVSATRPDHTVIELTLADRVDKEAIITGTLDLSLQLAPGNAELVQSAALPVPPLTSKLEIYGVYPHMHRYGRALDVAYDRGGDSTCLAKVPDYDFNWQQFFFYDQPVIITPPGGGYFRISCTYDTRGATDTIYWGEGTDDEMCLAGLYVTF